MPSHCSFCSKPTVFAGMDFRLFRYVEARHKQLYYFSPLPNLRKLRSRYAILHKKSQAEKTSHLVCGIDLNDPVVYLCPCRCASYVYCFNSIDKTARNGYREVACVSKCLSTAYTHLHLSNSRQ